MKHIGESPISHREQSRQTCSSYSTLCLYDGRLHCFGRKASRYSLYRRRYLCTQHNL